MATTNFLLRLSKIQLCVDGNGTLMRMRRYSATLSSFVDGAKFAKVNNSCDWIIMLSRGRGLRVEYFASQIKTESSLRNFTKKAALFRFDYFPVGLESNVYGIVGCASSNDDSPIDETFVQKLVRFFLDVKFSSLISSKELDSLDFVK